MANKKINELDSRSSLSLSDLMAVGDPSTGYLYKTTISDLKTLTGAGVVSFNGRFGSVVPVEGDYTLTQLGDVIITSASSGQVLQYNGSNWVNATIDLSGYVTLSGTQTITGSKTFSSFTEFNNSIYANAEIRLAAVGAAYQTWLRNINAVGVVTSGFNSIGFNSNNNLYFTADSKGYCEFAFSNPGTGRTYTLPGTSGTFALTSQIHDQLTIGTANGLSLSTQVLSLGLSSTSTNGALSSSDWNTFNNKASTAALSSYLPLAGGTMTGKLTINTGGTDNQFQVVGTAPSYRMTNAVSGATINGFIAMAGATDNYITGAVSGDMCIGNQNNGKIIFGFGSGTATPKMTMLSSGNVGIGLTAPTQPLHVYTTATTTSSYFETNSVNSYIGLKSTSGVCFIGNVSHALSFEAGGAERMRITSGGNVGIGTSSPNAKLDVEGAIYASGTGGFASAGFVVNARNPIWRFGNADSFGLSYFQGTAGSGGNDVIGLHFGNPTSSGSPFQFLQNGNYIFAGVPISDRRAKENINELTFNGIKKVMALQSKSYYMKEGNNKIKYGFIAQEVYEVLPDLICGDFENESIVGLDYNGLIPVLVKAIQEQQEQIEELKAKIK